jgi:hypothetical protein
MNDQPAKGPTLADQVAAVDALFVARQIATYGTRTAIQASTVEIMALAQFVMRLSALAELTFDMLAAADAVRDETNLDNRKALQRDFACRVDLVGVSLEALGYGHQPETTNQEKPDGIAS